MKDFGKQMEKPVMWSSFYACFLVGLNETFCGLQ